MDSIKQRLVQINKDQIDKNYTYFDGTWKGWKFDTFLQSLELTELRKAIPLDMIHLYMDCKGLWTIRLINSSNRGTNRYYIFITPLTKNRIVCVWYPARGSKISRELANSWDDAIKFVERIIETQLNKKK